MNTLNVLRPAGKVAALMLISLLALDSLLAQRVPPPPTEHPSSALLVQSVKNLEKDIARLPNATAVKEQLHLDELLRLAALAPERMDRATVDKMHTILENVKAFSRDPKHRTVAERPAFRAFEQSLTKHTVTLVVAKPPTGKPTLKVDAHIKMTKTRQLVDMSYFRMNAPQVITGLVADVQQGKLPRKVLKDVASPKAVDALVATHWQGFIPEAMAAKHLQLAAPLKGDSPKTPRKPIAKYTAAQMDLAKWDVILGNVKSITLSGQVSYAPETIDMGLFPYYQTRTAVLSVTSPNASDVTVSWKPVKPQKIGQFGRPGALGLLETSTLLVAHEALAPEPDPWTFKMLSYTGQFTAGGAPKVDKVVPGTGPLPVKAGQDFVVQISFKSPFPFGGMEPTLLVTGNNWQIEVPLKVGVLDIEEYNVSATFDEPLMNLVTPWMLVPLPNDGSVLPFGVSVKNTGDKPVIAAFEGASLPTGISLDPLSVSLGKGETQHKSLTFRAASGTPTGQGMPGSIKVTYATGKSYLLPLQFTVRESMVQWTASWEIRDKVTWETQVSAGSTGWWHWTAHLHDSSTFTGDAFVVGFCFNTVVDGQWPGKMELGNLGAKYSGPATNYWIDYSSTKQSIQSRWPEFADNGVYFYANAYDDLSAVVDWVAKVGLAAAIAALI